MTAPIATAGGTMDGFLALPPAGSGPGLLLLQEIFGVTQHIRAVAGVDAAVADYGGGSQGQLALATQLSSAQLSDAVS